VTRSPLARAAGALLALAALATAAACGSGSAATTASASSASADLTSITLSGAPGAKPTVKIPTPFSVKQTSKRVLTAGTGPTVTTGQKVTVDYTGFNGADGKEFDSSLGAGKKAPSFVLDPGQTLAGLVKGLVGQNVGSRLLLAIPPADGYGTTGAASAGIGPTDTILIVVEIKGVRNVLSRAIGAAVAPKAGLPAVKLAADGKPAITVPAGNPPAQLVVQPLIVGQGAKVEKGQQITVHYTGVVWPGGKQFDSSWDSGKPATFGIGVGQVIAGWDEGLVGQPIGSQLLMVIPPDKGYGAAGKPDGGIKGTDTLVFVVDILDAS
jgi:peptidylprolyl isomerase